MSVINKLSGLGCCCEGDEYYYSPDGPCQCCGERNKIATFNFADDAPCTDPIPVLFNCAGDFNGHQTLWSDLNSRSVVLYPYSVTCNSDGTTFFAEATYIGTLTADVRVLLCHATDEGQCQCVITFEVTVIAHCVMSGLNGQSPSSSVVESEIQFENITDLASVCSTFGSIGAPELTNYSIEPCGQWIHTRATTPVGSVTIE